MTNHEISFMPFKRDIRSKGIKTASSSLPGETDYDADQDIRMDVGKMDVFNYALYQNGIPPVRGIRIFNNTGLPVDGLSLRISSDFAFFHPREAGLPQIPSGKGKPVTIDDPGLVIDGKVLAELTETVNAMITVDLLRNGEIVCSCRGKMMILAYDQWQGGESYRDLLPAFVLPNHPAIPTLMHDAAKRLEKWGKPSSLEGYQSHDPNRVRDLAAAAYAVIQKNNIVYAEPPASFSVPGQRIRTPETILEQHLGTCMDMTLLYAALLEAMGLHPLLVMMQSHIFAGVWLRERTPEELKTSDLIIDRLEELRKRIDNGSDEMTFVECTAMCSGKQVNFEEAENIAKYRNLGDSDGFQFAVDVFLTRLHGITPLPSRIRDGGGYSIDTEEIRESEITEAPKNLGISISSVSESKLVPKKITNKKELWESKLLDLSQHNMLLNLPLNAAVMPIMSSHVDELEDALADGHEFHILPVEKEISDLAYIKRDESGKESEPIQWLPEAIQRYGVFELTDWPVSKNFDFREKLRKEYRNHRLYTFCGEKQIDRELTKIYRAARASQQENGVSSLYLAIGLLRWFADPASGVPSYAPLILFPVEIVRKSANQGYALHARDEDSHFNTTLLEMLAQNYNLKISGLDPLPADEHGTDIKKTFAIVRGAVLSIPGWDVVESCVIGNFSFAQFAMWNDIHTAGHALEQSKVVRSLMKGHVDWDISADQREEEAYLPITVDGTQLQAIQKAAKGTTFVLHGPPGTGKSQTITGMIANLMAQGKKVLFVAEKMAALSVVQKRLSSLGIGAFCLELHSDKANKKQVLSQLEKALAIRHPSRKSEYAEGLAKAKAGRAKLDGYVQHLHTVHNSGYSLHDLIDMYETVRDAKTFVPFNAREAGSLSREDVRRHLPLLSKLIIAGEAVGDIKGNPLREIKLTSYSADVRSGIRREVEEYESALYDLQKSSTVVSALPGMGQPLRRQDYEKLDQILAFYLDKREAEPALLDLLQKDSEAVRAYLEKEDSLQKWKEVLLGIWKEDFLNVDLNSILARHELAAKKFFGKASAMAAVTAEVQAYARNPVTYDMIPPMLLPLQGFQAEREAHKAAFDSLSGDAKSLLSEYPSLSSLDSACMAANNYLHQAEMFPGGIQAIRALGNNADTVARFLEYRNSYKRLLEAEESFNSLLCRENMSGQGNDEGRGGNPDSSTAENQQTAQSHENWITYEQNLCEYLRGHRSALKDWGLYNQIRQECVNVGLRPAVEAFENGLSGENLIPAYKKGFYYALIMEIIYGDDVLSSFSGVTFNESIRQFKRLDDMLLTQTREEIFYLLASRVPTSWDSPETGKELNLLRKAIGSNARGMSIRVLFERIPNVLQTLCPCMLMSPNSVAQYLAQKNDLFDVVIFDEASQLPTCTAVGALFRAKDAVIVGDPRQMPPTSFFAGSGPEVEDLALADLDSILDDALALGIPSQHLQWHYRSTHESLIAFSNSHFYGNHMFTFPSANDRERHVTAVHVDGIYKNNTNLKEAEAVVAEIVQRFRDPKRKNQSIGVVTFNVKQQALIENLLAKQYQTDPALDAWANGGEDPLFVKNLENVQGDERDVILFSIGYGPDEKGRLSMNFGPINKAGGGKRLNVAFSRSRVAMTIFASLYSTDIKVTENSPEGLIAFRDFLHYAEGNDLSPAGKQRSKEESEGAGILQSICRVIRENGFQCETMVGHSDFHVDLAVIDPFDPTKYMMGILLDGDGYRKTRNTRDREVAQISVLKNLGWTLYRIWTIDWWDDREREIRRLVERLNTLKAEAEKRNAAAKAEEEARRGKETADENEISRLRAELEAQAAEVVADDEEAVREDQDLRLKAEPVIRLPKADVEGENIPPKTVSEEEEAGHEDDTLRSKTDFENEPVKVSADEKGTQDPLIDAFRRLYEVKAEIIDKRKNGGALWVKGGKELSDIMQVFKALGVSFHFKKGGGRATKGEDAWYSQNQSVQIPTVDQMTAVSQDTANDIDYSRNTSVGNPAERFESRNKETVNAEDDFDYSRNTSVGNPAERFESRNTEIVNTGDDIDCSRNTSAGNTASRIRTADYALCDYTIADLPTDKMTSADFASSKNSKLIQERALYILQAEAPIQKELLVRRILKSFGVSGTKTVNETIEKTLKAVKTKTTKQSGIIYCWLRDQDPNTYRIIRGGDSSKKSRIVTEICQQEMKNAICYVLQEKGAMDKSTLLKEVSRILGYQRMTETISSSIETGLKYAKRSGVIGTDSNKNYTLKN